MAGGFAILASLWVLLSSASALNATSGSRAAHDQLLRTEVGSATLATSASGKLVYADRHSRVITKGGLKETMDHTAITAGRWTIHSGGGGATSGASWGALKIAGSHNWCLKGAPSSNDSLEVVQVDQCNKNRDRFLFKHDKTTHTLRFCHPSAAISNTGQSVCSWNKCLVATLNDGQSQIANGSFVKRRPCSNHRNQKWTLKHTESGYEYIAIKGHTGNLCLSLKVASQQLRMITCGAKHAGAKPTAPNGWEYLWDFPYQPTAS